MSFSVTILHFYFFRARKTWHRSLIIFWDVKSAHGHPLLNTCALNKIYSSCCLKGETHSQTYCEDIHLIFIFTYLIYNINVAVVRLVRSAFLNLKLFRSYLKLRCQGSGLVTIGKYSIYSSESALAMCTSYPTSAIPSWMWI